MKSLFHLIHQLAKLLLTKKLNALKTIDNSLYIEFQEMVDCLMLQGDKRRENVEIYLRKAKSTGTKCWEFIDDPNDKRKVLVKYEALKDNYKELVQKKFGNPYDYIETQPIKNLVQKDFKAQQFFLTAIVGGKNLPTETVNKYTIAASWLNMLVKIGDDVRFIKKELGLSKLEFWDNVSVIIKAEKIDLPSSYGKLVSQKDSAIKKYKASGYASLIDPRFGNKSAAKITDDIAKDVLADLIANHNQHDDTIILLAYNKWAVDNNKKPILAPQTIGNFRRENDHLLRIERNGNSDWYNTYGKVIKGKRPAAPLFLVEHDDNDLDKYFKDGDNNYYRFKLICVKDAYKDYILGWAAGSEVSIELIQAAYLDAMHHIKQLTGGWYLPHQLKSDRWGIDKDLKGVLAQFYKKIDPKFFPAKTARSKYIESSFGTRWHQFLKMDDLNNYAGHNITSLSRINRDELDLNKKNFPSKEVGLYYINAFINALRSQKNSDGKTLTQQWTEKFFECELSQQRQIDRTSMLLTFGMKHIVPSAQNPELPNSITSSGIELTIAGEDYNFDIPDEYYLPNISKKVQVIYDPLDMSDVLVTDNNSLRFIAPEMRSVSRTRIEMTEHDNSIYWQKMHQKQRHMQLVADAAFERKNRLQKAGVNSKKLLNSMIEIPDPEALLQAGVLTKELKQAAETSYTKKQLTMNAQNDAWDEKQMNFLNENNDFDSFFKTESL